jgi:hypothetical protein
MELVTTARGRVFSCDCGKVIRVESKKKEEVPEAEVEEVEVAAEDSEEAKRHRKKLRRAREERWRQQRGILGVVEDHLSIVLVITLLVWCMGTVLMVIVPPLGIGLVILGLIAITLSELLAPTSVQHDTEGLSYFAPIAIVLKLPFLVVLRAIVLFVNYHETWRALLLLMFGFGMMLTGAIGVLVWLV